MPPASRRPVFTIASWAAPVVLALITLGVAHLAEAAGRARGQWLGGLFELVVGLFVVATAAFGCGLAAVLRRERHCWVAVVPLLAGLGFFLDFAWQRFH